MPTKVTKQKEPPSIQKKPVRQRTKTLKERALELELGMFLFKKGWSICQSERHLTFFLLGITSVLTLSILLAYYLGFHTFKKYIVLSYKIADNQYGKGSDDIYYVAYWVVTFTFLRASTMRFVYLPIGKWWGMDRSKRQRFAEQGWMFSYYIVFWSVGMHIMYHSPHWLNTSFYWIDYPHLTMTKQMKMYYLMQLAFWIQQVYTIHVEKKRKDHFAMVTHHFITITLIVSSYASNFTRIGNAVLCCMDLCDICLSVSYKVCVRLIVIYIYMCNSLPRS